VKRSSTFPESEADRMALLEASRQRKMARSAHAYVRGNTKQFYEWLASQTTVAIPQGPPVWICGDCHVGNLGPLADASGHIGIQIRDLDQTVIGNPAHDLIRLALSLASAARGSNLPGSATAHILESIMEGYEFAVSKDFDEKAEEIQQPLAVRIVMKKASKRTWKTLANERIGDTKPVIPLGKRFWPPTKEEQTEIEALFAEPEIAQLATMVRSRSDKANVEVVDSAYWMKGCSSLGLLRFAVLVEVKDKRGKTDDLCLFDLKEGVDSVAPWAEGSQIPDNNAQRIVKGARHLSPYLGERMRYATIGDRSVVVRELMPQDLKIEFDRLSLDEALKAASYLAHVVGLAHARQMDTKARTTWSEELQRHRSEDLDAPSWLWSSVTALLIAHEEAYLEHCRLFALST
jgi:uncharacterized protein (DUF2252 family)